MVTTQTLESNCLDLLLGSGIASLCETAKLTNSFVPQCAHPNMRIIKPISQVVVRIKWLKGFPGGSDGKACSAGGLGSIPGLGRSPGEGNGNPLQYSCLVNRMDGGAWWATVHGVAKSRTRLHFHFKWLNTYRSPRTGQAHIKGFGMWYFPSYLPLWTRFLTYV